MANKKVLFPFYGEYGHTLAYNHGWVRFLCRTKYKDYHKIAMSYPGHNLLYDECDEYIPLPDFIVEAVENHKLVQCMEFLRGDDNLIKRFDKYLVENFQDCEVVKHDRQIAPYQFDHRLGRQAFKKLKASDDTLKIDEDIKKLIAVFPRFRPHDTFRNYPRKNWIDIVAFLKTHGFKIVSIGSKQSTYSGSIGEDFKCVDRPLEEQVWFLNNCQLAICSMCGAIRFIQMCNTPCLTFGEKDYVLRVEAQENKKLEDSPFKSPYKCVYRNDWGHTAQEIFEEAIKMIGRK